MNVYSDAAPGLEFVERARSELTADEVENAASKGRNLSVKEALALARVADPPDA